VPDLSNSLSSRNKGDDLVVGPELINPFVPKLGSGSVIVLELLQRAGLPHIGYLPVHVGGGDIEAESAAFLGPQSGLNSVNLASRGSLKKCSDNYSARAFGRRPHVGTSLNRIGNPKYPTDGEIPDGQTATVEENVPCDLPSVPYRMVGAAREVQGGVRGERDDHLVKKHGPCTGCLLLPASRAPGTA
jgi:hypothetical protein